MKLFSKALINKTANVANKAKVMWNEMSEADKIVVIDAVLMPTLEAILITASEHVDKKYIIPGLRKRSEKAAKAYQSLGNAMYPIMKANTFAKMFVAYYEYAKSQSDSE